MAAWMVKVEVAAVVGVPLNTPVMLFSMRPAGIVPKVTLQVATGLAEAAKVVL